MQNQVSIKEIPGQIFEVQYEVNMKYAEMADITWLPAILQVKSFNIVLYKNN